jgi:hypothetical protein
MKIKESNMQGSDLMGIPIHKHDTKNIKSKKSKPKQYLPIAAKAIVEF